ncbi:glycosyltransferase family 4 protein [Streptomyces meridianus]|uniref:D-inositol 3-phosphate glycosyltransferase n=1 Tax=Streptomyces meridianus TaxID=2938945 RepID=A0ABT0XD85_9ACTN|nr:glycosyltransferase family 4 protein [Streptomyces meridianus]MCM2580482.1 glycosyltransferase family 4 protein [Streptomyces meridianus]
MKIALLLHNAYGIGGTVRTTMNLAAALAERHEVEIASMFRHRDRPRLAVDPRVRLVPLVDTRTGRDDRDQRCHRPAVVFPEAEKRHHQYSVLNDERVRAYLASCTADVVIGTRPGVNVYLARFAPRTALRIAQEHLTHDTHTARLRACLAPHYRTLDAVVTTTRADAMVYRSRMPLPGVRVLGIPNSVPEPAVAPSDGTSKIVAAAGRLAPGKRFDLLIRAFAIVAAEHPDWTLRIHGGGAREERLRRLADSLGLGSAVELTGPVSPIEPEFARASILAVASELESFGMTIVEAMRVGVPVVSTDCPLGPGEIITDGVDGRLVPPGDAAALAAALCDLIEDDEGRRAMGKAALENSRRYDPGALARRYEQLFCELDVTRRLRARVRRRAAFRRRLGRLVRSVNRPLGDFLGDITRTPLTDPVPAAAGEEPAAAAAPARREPVGAGRTQILR